MNKPKQQNTYEVEGQSTHLNWYPAKEIDEWWAEVEEQYINSKDGLKLGELKDAEWRNKIISECDRFITGYGINSYEGRCVFTLREFLLSENKNV